MRQLLKTVFWLRALQLAIGTLMSVGLFTGGFFLLKDASAEFSGLAMIFAGVVVFLMPIILLFAKGRFTG